MPRRMLEIHTVYVKSSNENVVQNISPLFSDSIVVLLWWSLRIIVSPALAFENGLTTEKFPIRYCKFQLNWLVKK